MAKYTKLICPSCGYNGSPEGAGFTLVRELMARYVIDPIVGLDEVKVQGLADPEPTSYAACDECDYEGVFSEFWSDSMSNGIDIHIAAVGDAYTVTVDGIVAYQTPFRADARRYAARVATEWAALISQGTVAV